jgi:tetratricopeptide (TPR) repeat protein
MQKKGQTTQQSTNDKITVKNLRDQAYALFTLNKFEEAIPVFNNLITNPAYKSVTSSKDFVTDFQSYYPLLFCESDIVRSNTYNTMRVTLGQCFLCEKSIQKLFFTKSTSFLTPDRLYTSLYLCGIVCKEAEKADEARKFFAQFILEDNNRLGLVAEYVYDVAGYMLNYFPFKSLESTKVFFKVINSPQFKADLNEPNPVKHLTILEDAVITSENHSTLDDQVKLIRQYLFHPTFTSSRNEPIDFERICYALHVLSSAKCDDEFLKAYSLYFGVPANKTKMKAQTVFQLETMAARAFNARKEFASAIKILTPYLNEGDSERSLRSVKNERAASALVNAYFETDQTSQMSELLKRVLPSLSAERKSKIGRFLGWHARAVYCYRRTRDYDLAAISAESCLDHIPDLMREIGFSNVCAFLIDGTHSFLQMNRMDAFKKGTDIMRNLAEQKHTGISEELKSTLLSYAAVGYLCLNDMNAFIASMSKCVETDQFPNQPIADLGKMRLAMAYSQKGKESDHKEAVRILDQYINQSRKDLSAPDFVPAAESSTGQVKPTKMSVRQLSTFDLISAMTCYMRAGQPTKARDLAKQARVQLEKPTADNIKSYLFLAYAFSQSNSDKDHAQSKRILEQLKDVAVNRIAILGVETVQSSAESRVGFQLSLQDVAENGAGLFEKLKKHVHLLGDSEDFSTSTNADSFEWETSLPVNLKKDYVTAHAQQHEKIKRTGIADPSKSCSTSSGISKEDQDEDEESEDTPLSLTTGARTMLERFETQEWKEDKAIRWHDIETFFTPNRGVIFTVHGSGTDHVTFTIYKKGSDLQSKSKQQDNRSITLVNKGSKTFPIKFYLKKELRSILLEMGYLTIPAEENKS